jgi:hypothetical protein
MLNGRSCETARRPLATSLRSTDVRPLRTSSCRCPLPVRRFVALRRLRSWMRLGRATIARVDRHGGRQQGTWNQPPSHLHAASPTLTARRRCPDTRSATNAGIESPKTPQYFRRVQPTRQARRPPRYIDSAVSTQAVQHEIEHIEIPELPAEGDVGVLITQGAGKHEIDVAIREPAVRPETHAAEFG